MQTEQYWDVFSVNQCQQCLEANFLILLPDEDYLYGRHLYSSPKVLERPNLLVLLFTEDWVKWAGLIKRFLTCLDETKAEILISCLMLSFWTQTCMSSVYSRNNRIGFSVPTLLERTVCPFYYFFLVDVHTFLQLVLEFVVLYHSRQVKPWQQHLASLEK